MKSLVIAAAMTLSSASAQAQEAIDPQGILAIAKMTGACGILDSMIGFQKTTRMSGGDEFVARFGQWRQLD